MTQSDKDELFQYDESDELFPAILRGELRSARRLLQRRQRAATGFFLAEGAQAVREALALPGVVDTLIVSHPDQHANLIEAAADDVEILSGSRDDLAALSDTVTPQGIVAVCHWDPPTLDELGDAKLVLICAHVRDPGNAGTIIRCADAFGADAVILTEGSVDATNSKVVRSSVGCIFHLPIVTDVRLEDAVEWCHDKGIQVLAADTSGDPIDVMASHGELDKPTAWLTGNEAWGLPADDAALADRVASIPMWGRAESLNLSVATGICLYSSATAQKRSKAGPSDGVNK